MESNNETEDITEQVITIPVIPGRVRKTGRVEWGSKKGLLKRVTEFTPAEITLDKEKAKRFRRGPNPKGHKKAIAHMDEELTAAFDKPFEDRCPEAVRQAEAASYNITEGPSETYLKLIELGFVYDGVKPHGGGMGYHLCHDFVNPKYGRLSYETFPPDGYSDEPEQTDEEFEKSLVEHGTTHPYRQYFGWYLLVTKGGLPEDEYGSTEVSARILTGPDVEDLEEVLKKLDAEGPDEYLV